MLEIRVYHTDDIDYSVANSTTDPFGNTFETLVNNGKPCNYLTFDGKGINLLDENLKFCEDGDYMGWCTATESDANGIFKTISNTLIIGDENGTNPYTQYPEDLTIVFKENCCGQIVVEYSNALGTTPSKSATYNVNSNIVTLSLQKGYRFATIRFIKSALPNQVVRIESIVFGTANTFNRFTNHNLIEEINVLSDDLPINQFEATIVNPAHIELYKKDTLIVYSNKKYYGDFSITKSERIAENLYSVVAQNAISNLDSEPFTSWEQGAEPFKDILERLQDTSGVEIIDNSNVDFMISGNLKHPSCRMVLCAAGFAAGFMVDSSRRNNIVLKPIATEITSTILTSDRRIIGDAILTRSDEISKAKIKYTGVSNVSGARADELLSVDVEVIPSQNTVYTFNEPIYIDSVDVENGDVEYIYCDLYSVCFKVNGTANIATINYYASRVWENEETVLNENATVNNTKEFNQLPVKAWYTSDLPTPDKVIFEPIFVTHISRALDVKKYIKSRGKVKAKIRLRNEKVGDLIQIETAWDGIVTGIITKLNTIFGYEDIADIEVLEWNS